jgi:predicted nucleic acid-binding protein
VTEEVPFLDTNIFLRHLTADHPVRSPECLRLFQAIEEGRLSAWTTHLVIFEVVFTLRRFYGVEPARIAELMIPILELSGVKLTQKRLYRRVFELFTFDALGFADAYHAALLEHRGQSRLISYDREFDRVPGLQRLEPRSLLLDG